MFRLLYARPPFLSQTYHRFPNQTNTNTASATSGAVTVYPSG